MSRRPPRLAVWLLERLLPAELRADVVGDLVEVYEAGNDAAGGKRSSLWFWAQALRLGFAYRRDDRRSLLGTLLQDLRDAVRSVLRSPGYALACGVILALGLGAVATIYAVADAVLLRPLAYPDPEQLVAIWGRYDNEQLDRLPLTAWDVAHLRDNAETLQDVGALFQGNTTITGDGEAEEVGFGWFTYNMLPLMGVEPILGRGLTPDDARQLVVIMEQGLWERRFAADPDIVGKTVTLAQQTWEVIGVLPDQPRLLMPSRSRLPARTELWSMVNIPDNPEKSGAWNRLVGRLAPGATVEQARAELEALAAAERETTPQRADVGFGYEVYPLIDDFNAEVAPMVRMVLGAGVTLLLITATNLAGLMLLWGERRGREIAVRMALGSGRARLFRHVLLGGMLIGLLGFVGAIALASSWISILPTLNLPDLPRMNTVALDPRTIGVTLVIALGCGALFALPTALRSTRRGVESSLRSSTNAVTRRLRSATFLVAGEIALAVILLVGASLLVRTMANITQVDPGFDAGGTLTFRTTMPFADLFAEREAYFQLQRELDTALAELPGVVGAGATQMLPLAGGLSTGPYSAEIAADLDESGAPQADYRVASPGFLEAIGARLVEGRYQTWDDPADAVVIDSVLAQTLWPGESAVGKQLGAAPLGGEEGSQQVVGVVQHLRHDSLVADGRPTVFFSLAHTPRGYLTMAVRTAGDPASLLPAVRAKLAEVHPDLPIGRVRVMSDWVAAASVEQRTATWLLGGFALMAVLLVGIGLYSLLGFEVRLQSREMGLRLALGAEPGRAIRTVVRRAALVAVAGLALGAVLAVPATRAVSNLLFNVERLDPWAWTGMLAGLAVLTLLASAIPARRAAAVDPVEVLRTD